jgi:malate dehydrogenase
MQRLGPPPAPPGPTAALYRRGGPGGAAIETGDRPPGRVVVVGAGNVGTSIAQHLAVARCFDEVVLVDVVPGLAAGKALDLWHGAALVEFETRVRGEISIEDAGPAEFVVITAGRPRQPGMSRRDLAEVNADIVGGAARTIASSSPDAIVVVVTNPLDEMTQLAFEATGFPARRVMGMAGLLDAARFRALVALEPGVGRPQDVHAIALGSHGDEMVIPLSLATIEGRPIRDVLPADRLGAIVARTRDSGAEVVELLQHGSAFLTPGVATARMVVAMAEDTGEVVPAAVMSGGAFGLPNVYLGLPARLARRGAVQVVELPLEPNELTALRAAAESIARRVGTGHRAA